MRTPGLVLLFLLLVTLAWWALGRGEAPPSPLDGPVQAAETEVEPLAVTTETGADTTPAAPTDSEGPARTDVKSAPAPASRPTTEPALVLAGTVVVIEPDGTEHRATNGTLQITLWTHEGGGRGHPTPVTDGAWRIELGPTATPPRFASISTGELDGKNLVRRFDREPVVRTEDGIEPITLRAAWVGTQTLRVIDAVSKVDLQQVDVATTRLWQATDSPHPGATSQREALVTDASSPFDLPTNDRAAQVIWVTAPGYAWKKVKLSNESSSTWTVALQPGSALEVQWNAIEEDLALRIRDARDAPNIAAAVVLNGAPVASCEDLPDPTNNRQIVKFDSMPPGRYLVRLEKGDWWSDPAVFAVELVELPARSHKLVELTLTEPVAGPESAPLRGTLSIGEGWSEQPSGIEINPVGDTERWAETQQADTLASRGARLWNWSLGPTPIGRYEVIVEPYQHRHMVDVVAGGTQTDIHVPSPAHVRISLHDTDGKRLNAGHVMWYSDLPEGVRSTGLKDAKTVDGHFEFECPPGGINTLVQLSGHWARPPTRFDVVSGTNEFVINMAPLIPLRLVTRCGPQPVVIEHTHRIRLEHLDGKRETVHWDGQGLAVATPGRYRLVLPEIEGFATPEPREIDIAADGSTVIEVEFTRQ